MLDSTNGLPTRLTHDDRIAACMVQNETRMQAADSKLAAPSPQGITGKMPEAGLLYAHVAAATVIASIDKGLEMLLAVAARNNAGSPCPHVTAPRGGEVRPEWMSVKDAAVILGVSPKLIYKWHARGAIKTMVKVGKVLVHCSEVKDNRMRRNF